MAVVSKDKREKNEIKSVFTNMANSHAISIGKKRAFSSQMTSWTSKKAAKGGRDPKSSGPSSLPFCASVKFSHEYRVYPRIQQANKIPQNRGLGTLDWFGTSFHCFRTPVGIYAFQTKMWHSNLEKFRRALIFDADKSGASESFG